MLFHGEPFELPENRNNMIVFLWRTNDSTGEILNCLKFRNVRLWSIAPDWRAVKKFTENQRVDNKRLLDEVFVISRIIEDEVGVISRSRRLRLITLSETSIILDITKTESNNCFIIQWTNKKEKSCFCFFTNGKQHKAREVDMITPRNHAPRSYMTWLPVTLSVLDMIIV